MSLAPSPARGNGLSKLSDLAVKKAAPRGGFLLSGTCVRAAQGIDAVAFGVSSQRAWKFQEPQNV